MFKRAFQRCHATDPDDGIGVTLVQEGLDKAGAFNDEYGVSEGFRLLRQGADATASTICTKESVGIEGGRTICTGSQAGGEQQDASFKRDGGHDRFPDGVM
jgi:hypothetical protein